MCLDVMNGSTANGVKLQIWECTKNDSNQQFTVTGDDRIAWAGKGECLDLTDGNISAGTPVSLYRFRRRIYILIATIRTLGSNVEVYQRRHEPSLEQGTVAISSFLAPDFLSLTFLPPTPSLKIAFLDNSKNS
jgi:hypothetical protein